MRNVREHICNLLFYICTIKCRTLDCMLYVSNYKYSELLFTSAQEGRICVYVERIFMILVLRSCFNV
jgi:hypothetical protein